MNIPKMMRMQSISYCTDLDVTAFEAEKFLERQGFKYIKNSKIITLEKPYVSIKKSLRKEYEGTVLEWQTVSRGL